MNQSSTHTIDGRKVGIIKMPLQNCMQKAKILCQQTLDGFDHQMKKKMHADFLNLGQSAMDISPTMKSRNKLRRQWTYC
ncbi:hypothetical protein CVT25_013165 [Psilocybe cyanescens]|uniref:Uncharacterized protein n=1 Tax=Psilocybe cyanescens TaxID=93625 RepID=A0A409X0K9_PSICY|nr:hypothetical protein CVT25_013165 [Psilocybe cyanescens]